MSEVVAVKKKVGRPKATPKPAKLNVDEGQSMGFNEMKPLRFMDNYDRRNHTIKIAAKLAEIMIQARGGKPIPTVPIDAWRIAKEIVDLSYDGEQAKVPVVPVYSNLTPDQIAIMGNEGWAGDDD